MQGPRKEGGLGQLPFVGTPSLEAILTHGQDLNEHDTLYRLLTHLDFEFIHTVPMPQRLLRLGPEGIEDLEKEWGIKEGIKLYDLMMRDDAFTEMGQVWNWEWWQVWDKDPKETHVSLLNIQPAKSVEGWRLVLIKYGSEIDTTTNYLLGWLKEEELDRLILEASYLIDLDSGLPVPDDGETDEKRKRLIQR